MILNFLKVGPPSFGVSSGMRGLKGKDLKRLFVAHRREVQAYLTVRLRDREMAADLTQETFLRFAEQGARSAVLHDRSYLYRTAQNLAIDHLRRAIYTCRKLGIDAVGVEAPAFSGPGNTRYRVREQGALLLSWIDVRLAKMR